MIGLLLAGCTGVGPGYEAPRTPEHAAVVTTTDFTVGSLAVVDLDTFEVFDNLAPTSADPVVTVQGAQILQINRLGTDTVSLFEPGEWVPAAQFSVGAGTNPHDAVVIDEALFVSLYEEPQVAVFDLSGQPLGRVDLSEYAGSDGVPEVSDLVVYEDRVYAALQRLDRDDAWRDDGGLVVAINPVSFEVEQTWQVGPNPNLALRRAGGLLVRTGLYLRAEGGVRVLAPDTDTLHPYFLSALDEGVAITSYVEREDGRGFFIGEHAEDDYALYCWDGTQVIEAAASVAWPSDLALDPRGRAWVSHRGLQGVEGVSVWDPVTCAPLLDAPLATALAPYSIAFF